MYYTFWRYAAASEGRIDYVKATLFSRWLSTDYSHIILLFFGRPSHFLLDTQRGILHFQHYIRFSAAIAKMVRQFVIYLQIVVE